MTLNQISGILMAVCAIFALACGRFQKKAGKTFTGVGFAILEGFFWLGAVLCLLVIIFAPE